MIGQSYGLIVRCEAIVRAMRILDGTRRSARKARNRTRSNLEIAMKEPIARKVRFKGLEWLEHKVRMACLASIDMKWREWQALFAKSVRTELSNCMCNTHAG